MKMWIMWITLWRNIICNRIKTQKLKKNREKSGKIKKFDKKTKEFMLTSFPQKNPHADGGILPRKHVENVDNYFLRRSSPIFITSPAPIVIHKSRCVQLFRRKSSISAKDGK